MKHILLFCMLFFGMISTAQRYDFEYFTVCEYPEGYQDKDSSNLEACYTLPDPNYSITVQNSIIQVKGFNFDFEYYVQNEFWENGQTIYECYDNAVIILNDDYSYGEIQIFDDELGLTMRVLALNDGDWVKRE